MTDTVTKSASAKKPSHIAYHVRDNEGGKGFWTRMGGAWKHEDGKGFTILLDTVPLDGRIVIRIASEPKEE